MVNFQQVVYQCKSEDFCIFQSLGTLDYVSLCSGAGGFFQQLRIYCRN